MRKEQSGRDIRSMAKPQPNFFAILKITMAERGGLMRNLKAENFELKGKGRSGLYPNAPGAKERRSRGRKTGSIGLNGRLIAVWASKVPLREGSKKNSLSFLRGCRGET